MKKLVLVVMALVSLTGPLAWAEEDSDIGPLIAVSIDSANQMEWAGFMTGDSTFFVLAGVSLGVATLGITSNELNHQFHWITVGEVNLDQIRMEFKANNQSLKAFFTDLRGQKMHPRELLAKYQVNKSGFPETYRLLSLQNQAIRIRAQALKAQRDS